MDPAAALLIVGSGNAIIVIKVVGREGAGGLLHHAAVGVGRVGVVAALKSRRVGAVRLIVGSGGAALVVGGGGGADEDGGALEIGNL